MEIIKMELHELNAADYNPRIDLKPGDKEFEKIKRSIESFGLVEPIVYNKRTKNVVGGHQRLKVLLELGWTSTKVSVVDLSEDEEKTLNIALNKIEGDWDYNKLSVLLQGIVDTNLDITLTGFNSEDLAEILDMQVEDGVVEDVKDDEFPFDETVAELKFKDAETKYGDVWKLGPHLLVCGDATNARDVQKLIKEQKADLVVTDPPYNVAVKSDAKQLTEDGHSEIMNDDMEDESFKELLLSIFKQYSRIMSEQAAIYVFHPFSYQREFEDAMNVHGLISRSQCIWVKNAATFGWAQYRYKHEPIFMLIKKENHLLGMETENRQLYGKLVFL
ncbi:ParB N-terminal domain-containing protein [Geomicrobium sp. JCM 19039]|uniref:DNA methyltransferase n=1 Tax=Geomicrobium sp. JCM 19039 TaxID=1460636 RepID=UPI000AB7E21E|nr:ParB N-terminal domain-containing protein [Geomicrobium sp. JCM 19039]